MFNIHLNIRSCMAAADGADCAQVATLSLVDLAGFERAKKTGADGQWMREARSINRSLAFLEQVRPTAAVPDPSNASQSC